MRKRNLHRQNKELCSKPLTDKKNYRRQFIAPSLTNL